MGVPGPSGGVTLYDGAVVDTGANMTMITPTFLQRIPVLLTPITSIPIAGVGGTQICDVYDLPRLTIGTLLSQVCIAQVSVVVGRLPGHLIALIGGDILRRFEDIRVYYDPLDPWFQIFPSTTSGIVGTALP
ncbi:MAG: aspartyl protease family protein [Sulfobacillus sp.]